MFGACNGRNNISQRHICGNLINILFNHRVQTHQCENSAIGGMSNKLSLFGQSHGINTMRFKSNNGKISAYTDNHNGHEQLITSCKFSYQKNTCQRSMHHTTHKPSHAKKGIVLFRHIYTDLIYIPQTCENETSNTSKKQTWRKDTTTSSTSIGSRRGKEFQ